MSQPIPYVGMQILVVVQERESIVQTLGVITKVVSPQTVNAVAFANVDHSLMRGGACAFASGLRYHEPTTPGDLSLGTWASLPPAPIAVTAGARETETTPEQPAPRPPRRK